MQLGSFIKYEKRYLHYKTKLLVLIAELEGADNVAADKKSKIVQRLDRVGSY